MPVPRLLCEIFGLEFKTPVVISDGCVGKNEALGVCIAPSVRVQLRLKFCKHTIIQKLI